MDIENLQFSLGSIASLLGIDAGEIVNALKEGEELKPQTEIDSWLGEQLTQRMNQARKRGHEDGHGRGKRESLTAKEKEIREKYKLESSGTLDELIEELMTQASKHDANPADIKKSTVYIEDMQRLKDQIVSLQKKLDEQDETNRRNLVRLQLDQIVPSILEESKFVLPQDEEIRRNLLSLLYDTLENDKVYLKQSEESKFPQPFSRDNDRPVEGSNFKPRDFPDYLSEHARRFFAQAKVDADKKSAGNQQTDKDKKTSVSFPEVKSHEDFIKVMQKMRQDKVPIEQRQEFKRQYEQSVSEGKIRQ